MQLGHLGGAPLKCKFQTFIISKCTEKGSKK